MYLQRSLVLSTFTQQNEGSGIGVTYVTVVKQFI